MYLVEVVLPLPLYQTFFYLSETFIISGVRVIVPFRTLHLIGIVKNCEEITEDEIKNSQIEYKYIEEVIDTEPLLPPELFPFLEWVAEYYLTPLGLVYKIALPSSVFTFPQKRIYLTEEGKEAIKRGEIPEVFSAIKKKGYNLKRFIKKYNLTQKEILKFQINELKKYLPQSTWTAAGLGKSQLIVNEWSLELGGHCRTGLEDNIKYDKTRLANGNEELVERLALLSNKFNRPVATPLEARKILGLG